MKLEIGARVANRVDGLGTITAVDSGANRYTVQYDSGLSDQGFPIEYFYSRFTTPEEYDRRLRISTLRSRIQHLLQAAMNDDLPSKSEVCTSPPTDDDMNLAEIWAQGSGASDSGHGLARMISARLAEKAVIAFYNRYGQSVEDISLSQINPQSSDDWKRYDLCVDGVCIDVKNARQFLINQNRYVRHCVKFKKTRDRENVKVAGVLSPWCTKEEIQRGGSIVRFLGTTDIGRIRQIQTMLNDGPLEFSLSDGLSGPKFLPSWIYDYSDDAYLCRDEALSEIKELIGREVDSGEIWEGKLSPAFIAAGIDVSSISGKGTIIARSQKELCKLLCTRIRTLGVSLPVIYLTLLEHFVNMLLGDVEEDVQFSRYKSLLIPVSDQGQNLIVESLGSRPSDACRPLYLYDPLESIATLIDTLSTLWERRNSNLRGIRWFQLQDLNLLRGRKNSESPWLTILAYCGGWIDGKGPCGKFPLVLGEHESCEHGKLICNRCGYCCAKCKTPKPEAT